MLKYFLLQISFNFISEVIWGNLWRIIFHNISVSIDQELSEVPWNFSSLLLLLVPEWRVSSEIFVNWVAVLSITFNLAHHLELDLKLGPDGLLDISIALSLLALELVARETHNVEPLFVVLVVELLELSVVLVGESAG
jgi:hypothetical protein